MKEYTTQDLKALGILSLKVNFFGRKKNIILRWGRARNKDGRFGCEFEESERQYMEERNEQLVWVETHFLKMFVRSDQKDELDNNSY